MIKDDLRSIAMLASCAPNDDEAGAERAFARIMDVANNAGRAFDPVAECIAHVETLKAQAIARGDATRSLWLHRMLGNLNKLRPL